MITATQLETLAAQQAAQEYRFSSRFQECFPQKLLWEDGTMAFRSHNGSYTLWAISPHIMLLETSPTKSLKWPWWSDLTWKTVVYFVIPCDDNIKQTRLHMINFLRNLECEFDIRAPKYLSTTEYAYEIKIPNCYWGIEELLKYEPTVLDDKINWF